MLSGEISILIETINYNSKEELLTKLRKMRQNTVRLSPKDRKIVKEMLGIAIQQVYHTSETEIMKHKKSGGEND